MRVRVQDFYEPLGAKRDGNIRVLERGYCHIEGITMLPFYAVHMSPIAARPEVCCVQFKCPASYHSHAYLVSGWLELDLGSEYTIKPIVRVLKIQCVPEKAGAPACRASGSTHEIAYEFCTHGSAMLQVLRNLVRPDGVNVRVDCVSRTSTLQLWGKPPAGLTYEPTLPVARFSLGRPVRLRIDGRRVVACLTTTGSRAKLNPIPPGKRHMNQRSTVERKRARHLLHASLRQDFEQLERDDVQREIGICLEALIVTLIAAAAPPKPAARAPQPRPAPAPRTGWAAQLNIEVDAAGSADAAVPVVGGAAAALDAATPGAAPADVPTPGVAAAAVTVAAPAALAAAAVAVPATPAPAAATADPIAAADQVAAGPISTTEPSANPPTCRSDFKTLQRAPVAGRVT